MQTDKSRRRFLDITLKGGLLGLLGAVFYPVFRFVVPPASGEANVSQIILPFTLQELSAETEKSKIFKFGNSLGIILVTPENEIKAFSAICTHLSCTVQYRSDLSMIWCACHNGQFDLKGRNIAGPPPSPLEEYAVHVDGSTGEIAISKSVANV